MALTASHAAMPALHRRAVATLAELRLAQGRLEEAERLVAGSDGHRETVLVIASLHLARGEAALAASTVRRRLDVVGPAQLESVRLLELLGEAEIALGEADAAVRRGRGLVQFGQGLGCRVAIARGERLRGQALAVSGDASARMHLETALSSFVGLEMPVEATRTRRLLAQSLHPIEPHVAADEARTALAVFEQLGAGREADAAAALLRALGVKAARTGPKGIGLLTRREREVLQLLGEGLTNPEIGSRLHVSRKTVEHHVAHVLSKLGARSRAEAAVVSVRARVTDRPAYRSSRRCSGRDRRGTLRV